MNQTDDLPGYFSGVVIEDLGSGCGLWREHVRQILRSPFVEDTTASWHKTADLLQIPRERLDGRLRELRYILLVDRRGYDEIASRVRVNDELLKQGKSPMHSRIVATYESVYMPSLREFFSGWSSTAAQDLIAKEDCIRSHDWPELATRVQGLRDKHGDGPGIVLCPKDMAFSSPLPSQQAAPGGDTARFFLRARLLQEIGRHVFSVSDCGGDEYMSEGLSHMFADAHLSDVERFWLRSRARVLDKTLKLGSFDCQVGAILTQDDFATHLFEDLANAITFGTEPVVFDVRGGWYIQREGSWILAFRHIDGLYYKLGQKVVLTSDRLLPKDTRGYIVALDPPKDDDCFVCVVFLGCNVTRWVSPRN